MMGKRALWVSIGGEERSHARGWTLIQMNMEMQIPLCTLGPDDGSGL